MYGMPPMGNPMGMGMGMPQYDIQFEMDIPRLLSLGFTTEEIGLLDTVVCTDGKASVQRMADTGIDYELAKKIKYAYDICCSRVIIDDSIDDLSKHFRKMFGQHRRIGIQDLAISSVIDVPRKAVIDGIRDEAFSIWNSMNYPVRERMYTVYEVSGSRIHIITDRRPVIKTAHGLKVDGVAEILEERKDRKIIVAIEKDYIRMVNRFLVLASLRRPEMHLGMIEMLCIEGTKVYVYAQLSKPTTSIKYREGSQRVYDYGFYPDEIGAKLQMEAQKLYQMLTGVCAVTHEPSMEYSIMPEERQEYSMEDEIEESLVD